jgi:hypothetical protein
LPRADHVSDVSANAMANPRRIGLVWFFFIVWCTCG